MDHSTPKSFQEQIQLLKSRGMIFDNEMRAEKYMAYIGYQRLSVYWQYFYIDKRTKERFRSNIKFEDILNLYIFDRKLRVLFFEASERIEICLKVLLSDALCMRFSDTFWYLKDDMFKSRIDHYMVNGELKEEVCDKKWVLFRINENLLKFKKGSSTLRNFVNINDTPVPSWDLVDMLTFGNFSNMMSLINGEYLKTLYDLFDLPKKTLDNWVECVVGVRNICAHYGLLYRRSFSATPVSLSKSKKRTINIDLENCKRSFFAQFSLFSYLIQKISPTSTWTLRVLKLIEENENNPLLSRKIMGFPDNWQNSDLFKNLL